MDLVNGINGMLKLLYLLYFFIIFANGNVWFGKHL